MVWSGKSLLFEIFTFLDNTCNVMLMEMFLKVMILPVVEMVAMIVKLVSIQDYGPLLVLLTTLTTSTTD